MLSLLVYVITICVIKMDEKKTLPQRKHLRLDKYDYSVAGAYFVTICTQNRRCVLSRVVGRGLAPAEENGLEYTLFGKIAERQLISLKERYPYLSVDQYVVMPNHIHVIFTLESEVAGASPRPTITDIVCAYKSLTTYKAGGKTER